jgi:glucose-6-phosphate dehydrogenase assembly protein OpcA
VALGPWDGILDLGYPGWLHQRLQPTTIRYEVPRTRYDSSVHNMKFQQQQFRFPAKLNIHSIC